MLGCGDNSKTRKTSIYFFFFYVTLLLFAGKISLAVVSALHYLHTKLKVIHRDVKPSNILINRQGQVKMCDFGISGYLVDSVAKTIDAGCKPYMAVSCYLQSSVKST